jgi:hypothetical protein
MIVRFMPSGRSFKWLSEYLTHDPKARSDERVAWTHTLNLAHDHPDSAVHEMLMTFNCRDLLKAEAGVRAGGAKLDKPVKHFSLNWHPSEQPSRKEMIDATQSFLKAMGWQDHQALLVAHTDKEHRHVHVMLNAVHPDKGARLDDGFERRRAQSWALGYEQLRGRIFCEERLKPVAEREASPPRNAWQELRRFQPERAVEEAGDPSLAAPTPDYSAHPRTWRAQEWAKVKEQQKAERIAFFANGGQIYRGLRNAVYKDVRATYKAEWRGYYALQRSGAPSRELKALRDDLVARQRATLTARIAEAALELRQHRDTSYRAILERQKWTRHELTERQGRGLQSPALFEAANDAHGDPVHRASAHQVLNATRDVAMRDVERGARWSVRGTMPAQQRSAARWHERAQERLSKTRIGESETARSRWSKAAERATTKDAKGVVVPVGRGAEPDR